MAWLWSRGKARSRGTNQICLRSWGWFRGGTAFSGGGILLGLGDIGMGEFGMFSLWEKGKFIGVEGRKSPRRGGFIH